MRANDGYPDDGYPDEESLAHDYIDGRNDERAGKTRDQNPYPNASPQGLEWLKGWDDRNAERNSLAVAERELLAEIDRSRLAINAARAAGWWQLSKIEDLHDRVLELRRRS